MPGARRSGNVKDAVTATLTRMLGLERDLADFYRIARDDKMLAPMADRMRGMKPVRFPTNFEAFANAVVCQQVSVSAGLHVLNRLTEAYGKAVSARGKVRTGGAATQYAFVEARDIARATPDRLRALGFSRPKATYLIDLARMAASNNDFAAFEALDDAEALARLCELRGVGRWTAEYVMLRGFGRINVFPADDVGGRNKLVEWLGVRRKLDYGGVRDLLARWHPYEGLIYIHLVVNGLLEQGLID